MFNILYLRSKEQDLLTRLDSYQILFNFVYELSYHIDKSFLNIVRTSILVLEVVLWMDIVK